MNDLPSIPTAPAAASGMNPVTTEGTPVRVTAPAAAAAGPPSPAKTFPVVARRANPPESRRKLKRSELLKYQGFHKITNTIHV